MGYLFYYYMVTATQQKLKTNSYLSTHSVSCITSHVFTYVRFTHLKLGECLCSEFSEQTSITGFRLLITRPFTWATAEFRPGRQTFGCRKHWLTNSFQGTFEKSVPAGDPGYVARLPAPPESVEASVGHFLTSR